jgi:hypothetical protein
VKCAFHAVVLAALLAGCGGAKPDYRNDKDTFGQAFTSEWRKQNAPAARSSAPTAAPPAAATVDAKPSGDANTERQQFEEWKRKNQK